MLLQNGNCDDVAALRDMVQQPTRRPVGGVHRTNEAKLLGQQFPHFCGLHFGELATSVHCSEVRQETLGIQFVGHNTLSTRLEQVQPRP